MKLDIKDQFKALPLSVIKEQYLEEALPFAVCMINTSQTNIQHLVDISLTFAAEKAIVISKNKLKVQSDLMPIDLYHGMDEKSFEYQLSFVDVMERNNYTPIFLDEAGIDVEKFKFTEVQEYIKFNNSNAKLCLVIGDSINGIPKGISETQYQFMGSSRIKITSKGLYKIDHNSPMAATAALSKVSVAHG